MLHQRINNGLAWPEHPECLLEGLQSRRLLKMTCSQINKRHTNCLLTFWKIDPRGQNRKICRFSCGTSSNRGANAGQSARAVMYGRRLSLAKWCQSMTRGHRSQLLLKACCCCLLVDSRSRNKSRSLCFWYLKASGNTCLLIFDYHTDISAVVVVVGCTGILYYGRYCLLSETSEVIAFEWCKCLSTTSS
jgi:hypothetical protein